MVTVYSQPNCQPCKATKRFLEKNGIDHEVIDLSQDHDAREFVVSLGYKETPVVVYGEQHWSGHRPTTLSKVLMP